MIPRSRSRAPYVGTIRALSWAKGRRRGGAYVFASRRGSRGGRPRSPGNIGHGQGKQCAVVTIGKRDGSIGSQVYALKDARRLATRLLVALATYDDELADKLLHEHFVSDGDGQYLWPEGSFGPE
jgi:hypothetical protein